MTIGTGKLAKMNHTVTFHAEGPRIASNQHEPIRGSMRCMADAASFEFLGLVLEYPWPSLLWMTLVANVRVKFIDLPQTRPRTRAMGGMTVRAFHRPLDHPMVVRKIKFGLHVPVAGKTEIWVFLLQ